MALVMTDRHVDAMMHGHQCFVRTFTDPGAQGPPAAAASTAADGPTGREGD
jgi:hypothetical protein